MSLADEIEVEFRRVSRERADALDALCWAMLADPGRRGIRVVADGLDWSAELTPDVPWLMIHDYPNGRHE